MSNLSPASGRFTRANSKSTSTPDMTVFMTGTNALSTAYDLILVWLKVSLGLRRLSHGYLGHCRPILQHGLELSEKVLLEDMPGTHTNRVDI